MRRRWDGASGARPGYSFGLSHGKQEIKGMKRLQRLQPPCSYVRAQGQSKVTPSTKGAQSKQDRDQTVAFMDEIHRCAVVDASLGFTVVAHSCGCAVKQNKVCNAADQLAVQRLSRGSCGESVWVPRRGGNDRNQVALGLIWFDILTLHNRTDGISWRLSYAAMSFDGIKRAAGESSRVGRLLNFIWDHGWFSFNVWDDYVGVFSEAREQSLRSARVSHR